MLSMLIRREIDARRRRALAALLFVVGLVSAPVRLASAQSSGLPQGARVRVDVGPVFTGVFLGARNDTLLILTDNRDTTVFWRGIFFPGRRIRGRRWFMICDQVMWWRMK